MSNFIQVGTLVYRDNSTLPLIKQSTSDFKKSKEKLLVEARIFLENEILTKLKES